MKCKSKYFFQVNSKGFTSPQISISLSEYHVVRNVFNFSLRINKYDYASGKTKIHLGSYESNNDLRYYKQNIFRLIDGDVIYSLIKIEYK